MHHRGYENIRYSPGLRAGKRALDDPDNFVKVLAVAHSYGSPDHFWICRKTARPVVMRKDGNGVRIWSEIVVLGEEPTHRWAQSEGAEHAAGYELHERLLHVRDRT